MDKKELICQVCGQSPATTVIDSLALCQQCSLPKFIINPALPTLTYVPIEGETRECRQCRMQLSKATANCINCGFVELSLVADTYEEEEKAPIPQSTKPEVVNSVCWTCPRCSYEYNQKQQACLKCQQPYQAPAAVPPPRESKPVAVSKGQFPDTKVLPIQPPAGDDDLDMEEMSSASQPKPLTSPTKWRCQCGSANPVFSETCHSCKVHFPQCAAPPWKCIHCAQNTYNDPCDQCKQKQGWSQYLKKKSVTLNGEKWMWQCKSCKLWTRIDISTCFFQHTNEAIKVALEGTASQSSSRGIFGSLKSLFS